MNDASKRKRIALHFPDDDEFAEILYLYLKKHVSNTALVFKAISPQFLFKALLASDADEKDIKQAAIDTLNFARQSMIDVLDSLALNNIQLPSEILLRHQNSLNNIVLTNMPAPPVAMPPQQSIAPPIQSITPPVDRSEAPQKDDSAISEEDYSQEDDESFTGQGFTEISSPLFGN
jgi:hypothetical protein